jgi:site-specific recombinase XerD
MLAKYFESKQRVHALCVGCAGALLEGFAGELWRAGYAQITSRRHIRAAEHLLYWAGQQGMGPHQLHEQALHSFDDHLIQCHCPGYGTADRPNLLNGARLFMGHLRGAGVIGASCADHTMQEPVLLAAFCQWMRQQRSTKDSTLCTYSISIRDLLRCLGQEPDRFDAQSLRQFVLDSSCRQGIAATKNCTTALRMFLRFLIAEGKCAAGLDAAIPVVAQWRLSSLPRYLQAEEVERVIASCDPVSPVGRRDRAILLLLARLGLRAGDIVQVRLADIDWKAAWICVAGKSRRQTQFPLTREVGQAIVDYLQDGRPQTDTDALFVRSRAPFRAFASHCAISVVVAQAMRRAGVKCPSRGAAHVLRHSVATSMLREGTSLQDIAAILGHRSITTTQIYAKVDITALQQITQPWPEVQPC